MKLIAKVDGERLNVEVVRGDTQVTATVDGREYALDVSQPEPNIYTFRSGGKLTEAFVSAGGSKVTIGGHEFEIDLTDPKRLRGSSVDAEHADAVIASSDHKTHFRHRWRRRRWRKFGFRQSVQRRGTRHAHLKAYATCRAVDE